ncbi:hypothetical protein G205_09243 [Arthrobacter nitrophenolicus]|uniref:Uncharacterized protein n=1 Tax=Arthrobacter nitrophenolicus TaxID=683150 RepID=L8TQ59_9MICC|nr:hypothetical protein G205_09243 [Arthrobacter nitrophenolicus]
MHDSLIGEHADDEIALTKYLEDSNVFAYLGPKAMGEFSESHCCMSGVDVTIVRQQECSGNP